MRQQEADDWFVETVPRPDADLIIAAFPGVGGGCAAFAQHARLMPDWLSVATLNLPGHQARFAEPPRTDLDSLTVELAQSCARRSEPYLLFGYCSGALLAYCVARLLHEQQAALPRRLIVGSSWPPHRAQVPPLAGLSSQRLWQVLADYQAVSPALIEHPEFRELSEPVLRADFALVGSYRHTAAPPLPIPVTVLVAEQDRWVTDDDVAPWADYTSAGLTVRRLPAGHWFMEEEPAASAAALIEQAAAEQRQPS